MPSTKLTNKLRKGQTSNSDKFSNLLDNSDFLNSYSYDETNKEKNPELSNYRSKQFLLKNDKTLIQDKTCQKPCVENYANNNVNNNFNCFSPIPDIESNFNNIFASSSRLFFNDLIVENSQENQPTEFVYNNDIDNKNSFWNSFNINGSYPFLTDEFSQENL